MVSFATCFRCAAEKSPVWTTQVNTTPIDVKYRNLHDYTAVSDKVDHIFWSDRQWKFIKEVENDASRRRN